MARWLVEHKIEPSFEELHAAVRQQQVDLVNLFLDSGMSPFEPTDPSKKSGQRNNDLETLFEMANTEILPLLLAKVPKEQLPNVLKENQFGILLNKTLAKRDLANEKSLLARELRQIDPSILRSAMRGPTTDHSQNEPSR